MVDVEGSVTPERIRHAGSTPFRSRLAPKLSVERNAVFVLLKQLAVDNQAYFGAHGSNLYHRRIVECCEELVGNADQISRSVQKLQEASFERDYDENTPGNGFRSLVCICDTVTLQLVAILKNCVDTRTSLMFRTKWICKELESFAAVFRFLILAFQHVVVLLDKLPDGSLFPPLEGDYAQHNGILKGIENLDASCFYGRSFGFQFCPSVTRIFRIIGIVLATYSLSWDTSCTALSSLMASSRFLLNPEQRAHRIIKVTREADIEFCRGFWNLSEIPAPKLFCPSMAVYEMVQVPMVGPLHLPGHDPARPVRIEQPHSHGPPAPVRMRLFSSHYRDGISKHLPGRSVLGASPHLVVHCHGGGYVATTSKSHETYLRAWARDLDCPLVSVEYSLAPEFPYPRAIEEVAYAYAWMLSHPQRLGWTGERLVMCGDSAGGNLVVSTTLHLIDLGVRRLPDGLVPIYTPFLFQYLPSPSRVLSFMDPLLHMGVVIRCAAAYTGACPNGTEAEKIRRAADMKNKVHHKTLMEYMEDIRQQRDNLNLFGSFADFSNQSIISLVNLTESSGVSGPSSSTPNSSAREEGGGGSRVIDFDADSSAGSLGPARAPALPPPADGKRSADSSDSAVQTGTEGEEEEEEEELEKDADEGVAQAHPNITMVHVDADPFHICLSANNYDHQLLDYLQAHPITKTAISAPIDEIEDDAFDDNADLSAAPAPCNTPRSVKSVNSFFRSPDRKSLGASAKKRVTQTDRPVRKERVTRGRSLSQSLMETASLAAAHAYDSFANWLDGDHSPLGLADKPKLTRSQTMSVYESALVQQAEAEQMDSCFTELLKLDLPRRANISPMYATADKLRQLPPVHFVACHLDPLLDDTISFARRLRDAGGRVASVDLLDALPHGFLNFTPMSSECRNGANTCLSRIQEALNH